MNSGAIIEALRGEISKTRPALFQELNELLTSLARENSDLKFAAEIETRAAASDQREKHILRSMVNILADKAAQLSGKPIPTEISRARKEAEQAFHDFEMASKPG